MRIERHQSRCQRRRLREENRSTLCVLLFCSVAYLWWWFQPPGRYKKMKMHLEFTLANHAPSRNDLARRRLAGVNLLAGIALGGGCGLLAEERFLCHGRCRVSTLLTALRNTLKQPDGQTRRGYQTTASRFKE